MSSAPYSPPPHHLHPLRHLRSLSSPVGWRYPFSSITCQKAWVEGIFSPSSHLSGWSQMFSFQGNAEACSKFSAREILSRGRGRKWQLLNTNGTKLKGGVLHVKKAAFGKESSGSRRRDVENSLACEREASEDPTDMRCIAGGGSILSSKEVLQGDRRETVRTIRGSGSLEIVISDEFSGVERLKQSCVIEWKPRCCDGFQASPCLSELGVEVKLLKMDRYRCLLLIDNEEDFRDVLALGGSWWEGRSVSMTPWSEELVSKPRREAWIRCHRVPLHARCSNTFMSIGQKWGDVLTVEFCSWENGLLDDGRILLFTEVLAPFNCSFTLRVDGKDFVL
ncbi:hypothetical protein Dimus_011706 [Dionaea muscipula]